jgi:hypothetical protein
MAGGGDRGERHADAEHVGEHVPGIGQQRQRAGQQGGERLDQHEGGEQGERGPEPAAVPLPRAVSAVIVSHAHAGKYMFTLPCMQRWH